MQDIANDELAGVTGGFGLRTLYRGAVNNVTATIGGYKLAHQMYDSDAQKASWSEVWRARGALKSYLDGSDKLPRWAPQW